jgi:hypothetical protein
MVRVPQPDPVRLFRYCVGRCYVHGCFHSRQGKRNFDAQVATLKNQGTERGVVKCLLELTAFAKAYPGIDHIPDDAEVSVN